MESSLAAAAGGGGPDPTARDVPFGTVLREVSRSLCAQVSLVGGCLALHPRPPPGFVDQSARAVDKLRTAVDEFWVDVARASGPAKSAEAGPAKPAEPLEPDSPGEDAEHDFERGARRGAAHHVIHLGEEDLRRGCELEPRPPPRAVFPLGEEEGGFKRRQSWILDEPPVLENTHTMTVMESAVRPSEHSDLATAASKSRFDGIGLAVYTSNDSRMSRRPSVEETNVEPPDSPPATPADANQLFIREDISVTDMDGEPFMVRGVLNPNWTGRLGWDFGVIALVLVDAMVLPYQMAYKDGADPDIFDIIWLCLTTSFFAIDIVLSFCTGYVAGPKDKHTEPGRLVTRRWRIVRHYLRGWFSIDLVSTIPWSTIAELATSGGSGSSAQVAKLTKVVKFVRFLRLMRMLRLAKLGMIWERIEAKMGSLILLQIVALFRVLFIVVSICHWNACIWWLVGQPKSLFTELLSEEGQVEWQAKPHWTTIKRAHDPESDLWSWIEKEKVEAYVFCFYWTLGVMRTMPSEVQPVNLAERIYVMCFMFFAVSAFAISVTLITQAFLKIGERRRVFNEDMAFARMHLRNIQASETLQSKVKTYLKHLFMRRRIQAKESNLFGQLPASLLKAMKCATVSAHLKRLESLASLGKKALYSVAEICEVRDLVAGERLCTKGMVAQGVWILVEGILHILYEDRGSGRRSSEDVDNFMIQVVDEECLGSRRGMASNQTVVARGACEVIFISKKKFFKAFKDILDVQGRPLGSSNAELAGQAGGNRRESALSTISSMDNNQQGSNVPGEAGLERQVSGETPEEQESPTMRMVGKNAAQTAAILSA